MTNMVTNHTAQFRQSVTHTSLGHIKVLLKIYTEALHCSYKTGYKFKSYEDFRVSQQLWQHCWTLFRRIRKELKNIRGGGARKWPIKVSLECLWREVELCVQFSTDIYYQMCMFSSKLRKILHINMCSVCKVFHIWKNTWSDQNTYDFHFLSNILFWLSDTVGYIQYTYSQNHYQL